MPVSNGLAHDRQSEQPAQLLVPENLICVTADLIEINFIEPFDFLSLFHIFTVAD